MSHHVGPPPATPDHYGYSCQIWFVLEIAGELFGAEARRAWFSLRFNPINNADSSNPSWLYTELSRAVQQNDVGSKLIEGYRAKLLDMVGKQEKAGELTAQQADDYERRIKSAPVGSFRPEVWRIDLRQVSRRKYGNEDAGQLMAELRERARLGVKPPQVLQPNEYLVEDLRTDENEVVIMG